LEQPAISRPVGERTSNLMEIPVRSDAFSANSEAPVLDPNAYFVDILLQSNSSGAECNDLTERGMVQQTFDHALLRRSIAPADMVYLTQVLAARTGMNDPEAEKRASDVFEQAQSSADKAGAANARSSLWLFARFFAERSVLVMPARWWQATRSCG
jgi:hypothetical protein